MTPTDPSSAGRPTTRLAKVISARPAFSPLTLSLIVSAYLLATANAMFFARVLTYLADRPALIPVAGFLAFAAIFFCISVFTLPGLVRPVLALALILGAVAAYYMDQLGAVIDRDMLQNALNTTGNESRHLITTRFVTNVLLFGVIPAALVLWTRPKPMRWWMRALHYPMALVLGLALFFGAMMVDYRTFSSMFRERREITSAVIPATPLIAAVRLAKLKLVTNNLVAAPIGLDAKKGARITAAGKPTLTVIVVGETARAANWSLSGYDRPTNPELARRDIIYLDNVQACGTATAVSMPCMFASYGMENHSETASRSNQNLLDLLKQTGFDVQWLDNNTGSLGIAARVGETRFKPADDPASCASGECTDMVFLPTLDKLLASITRDTVIVYHQIGNHGPAYYMRYPESFRPFPDDCRSSDFGACTQQQIVNAYDNSTAYTDLFLATVIDRLGAQDRVATSMFYASDHGESLGESGLYLHAAPYFMAPDVQTKVPMLLWTSPTYQAAMKLDPTCVKSAVTARAGTLTHDNFFQTVLGLVDVTTSLHNPKLDITAGCYD